MQAIKAILYKDILLWLQSKFGKYTQVIYLLLFVIGLLTVLINTNENQYYDSLGRDTFYVIGIIQVITFAVYWLIKWLFAVAGERENKTIDFMRVSWVQANHFIAGKFLAILGQICILFCISLPFIGITMLMWGVLISDIAYYTIYVATISSVSILAGLVLSSFCQKTWYAILQTAVIGLFCILLLSFFASIWYESSAYSPIEILYNVYLPIAIFNSWSLDMTLQSWLIITFHTIMSFLAIGTIRFMAENAFVRYYKLDQKFITWKVIVILLVAYCIQGLLFYLIWWVLFAIPNLLIANFFLLLLLLYNDTKIGINGTTKIQAMIFVFVLPILYCILLSISKWLWVYETIIIFFYLLLAIGTIISLYGIYRPFLTNILWRNTIHFVTLLFFFFLLPSILNQYFGFDIINISELLKFEDVNIYKSSTTIYYTSIMAISLLISIKTIIRSQKPIFLSHKR